MPTFRLWHLQPTTDDTYWVYGIDEWDARHQVAAALDIAAHDEVAFGCEEDRSVLVDLNYVVHKDGKLTACPVPEGENDEDFSVH